MATEAIGILLDIAVLIAMIVFLILLRSFLPSYFEEKGKNLATKEDISEITRLIEETKHQYSKGIEILRANLESQAHARDITFRHEFKILSDLWSALDDFGKAVHHFRSFPEGKILSDLPDIEKQELERKFNSASAKLHSVKSSNKPFIPEAIYEAVTLVTLQSEFERIRFLTSPSEQFPFSEAELARLDEYPDRIANSILLIAELIRIRIGQDELPSQRPGAPAVPTRTSEKLNELLSSLSHRQILSPEEFLPPDN